MPNLLRSHTLDLPIQQQQFQQQQQVMIQSQELMGGVKKQLEHFQESTNACGPLGHKTMIELENHALVSQLDNDRE